MPSVKLDKAKDEWVVATYCDYGVPGNKRVIRLSYSIESSKNAWNKFKKDFSRNNYRCWQENKKGIILNDSKEK